MNPPAAPNDVETVTTRTYVKVMVIEVVILLSLYWLSTYFG